MVSYASPLAGGGEALVEPTRSSSLPLGALFSSSSGSATATLSSASDNNVGNELSGNPRDEAFSPTRLLTSPGASLSPESSAGPPESSAGPSSRTLSAVGGLAARRFLSDPLTGSGNDSPGAPVPSSRGQRKPTRVLSLARWYERLASGQQRGGSPRASRHDSKYRQRSRGHGANSLSRDFAGAEGAADPMSAAGEIARLRVALQAEKAARAEAEAQSLSLRNALRNSKRKVDAQKQRMDELTAQLNESVDALAPVQEILAIAEVRLFLIPRLCVPAEFVFLSKWAPCQVQLRGTISISDEGFYSLWIICFFAPFFLFDVGISYFGLLSPKI